MKAAIEKLSAVGSELYQEAQKTAQATGPADTAQGTPPPPKKTEKKADVVDADFEVVDDENGDKKKK